MRIRDFLIVSKGTKVILGITFSVSLTAIVFAFFYYRSINNSEDPRIREAREYLLRYDKLSGKTNKLDGFLLLDSADQIFRSLPDYASSYETGLIFNNKSSALLVMAIYDSSVHAMEKRNLLELSMKYCDSSIAVYNRWIAEWDSLTPDRIAERIRPFMQEDDPVFKGLRFKRVLSRRVKNIVTAQVETPRRLSVSYTNKGTICRHLMKPDSSLILYQQALALWPDNRIAKSNLNVLLGGAPVKPSLIELLFPPDKNK
jgi:hypothetical protein